jgi:hypothetical protein
MNAFIRIYPVMNFLGLLHTVFFYHVVKYHQQRSNDEIKISARVHATSEKVLGSGNKLYTIWAYPHTRSI